MTIGDGEERFSLGLDVIINGLLETPTEGRLTRAAWGEQAAVSEQWFVVNVGDADWESKGEFGVRCRFESPDARFPHFGITVQVIQPGQPSSLYHAEEAQEGFLVLAGECLAVIEGQEHPLRQWDYFHCPPRNPPCPRRAPATGRARCSWSAPRAARRCRRSSIPRIPVAARHGASVAETTRSSKQAYADRTFTGPRRRARRGPTPDARRFIVRGAGTAKASQ